MGGRGRPVWKNRKIFPLPAKELDEETGYYYFGARYYDPRVSMWISTDPAIGKYLPTADQLFFPEDKFDFRSMPGIGGVYNSVNLNVYHYAGQNPIKLTDPDGETTLAPRFTPWLRGVAKPVERVGTSAKPFTTVDPLPVYIDPSTGAVFRKAKEGAWGQTKRWFKNLIDRIFKSEGDIDWNNPPKNPGELGDEWIKDENHKHGDGIRFRNKKTGEKIDWHHGKRNPDGSRMKGSKGKDHWHRLNPNKTRKNDAYLDKNGNPVKGGSKQSHIYPQ